MKTICIAYTIVLTVLLTVEEPIRLTGIEPESLDWLLPGAHLLSFTLLTVLALVPRWSVPRWAVVPILVAYGGCTELAQGAAGWRTPEWGDFTQDVTGIAAGMAIWWIGVLTWDHLQARRSDRQPSLPAPEDAQDEF